ncbi:ATP-binding protein [Streptomyces sp. IB2014 016-6]|uniref:ATP-binding protein n=1 Tax=Streptomyces sp. IB2014 016-6 TaxID=2517818 RepID=UPI001F4F8727|nr:ATP-binding protein [Streptomyces sp. IB2014 016-6]
MTTTAAKPNATGAPGYTAELPGAPESVGRARAFVSSALATWGLDDDLVGCGEVIVSELLTNVVDHTKTPLTKVVIERRVDCSVRIGVSDRSRVVPCMRAATDDGESGRGLRLVDALSSRWGYRRNRWGKVTWAEIKVLAGRGQ